MQETVLEYKHLMELKRSGGELSSVQEERLRELRDVLRAHRDSSSAGASPNARAATPAPAASQTSGPPRQRSNGSRARSSSDEGVQLVQVAPTPRAPSAIPTKTKSRAKSSSRAESAPKAGPKEKKRSGGLYALLVSKLPDHPRKRAMILAAFGFGVIVISAVVALVIGLPPLRAVSTMLPWSFLLAGLGWVAIYPGLMKMAEGSAERREPTFTNPTSRREPLASSRWSACSRFSV